MALALYRKYRPRTFAEVIGQEHVTEPLSQALRSGRLHHAYLFSGPRGCGKTSSARILARSLNCEQGPTPEPCGVCASCKSLANDGAGSIDVIEIDAASHGGVDDARDLREKAFFAPAGSRYKIYVIDEAHMVSSAGFNALLKLVEEPPEYVKFIFATTEPEKVLGTIRSRTHHYPFRLIPPAVLPLVVRAGGGSARDSLSVLDQLISGAGPEGVSYPRAVSLLGVTDVALIDEMCDALAAGDGAAAYQTIDRVAEAGHDPRRFASDLLERFRDLIVLQQVPDAVTKGLIDGPADQLEQMGAQATRLGPATLSRCADIVHNGLIEMRGTTAPRLLLELITARMLLPGADDANNALLQRLERMERRLTLTADPVRPEQVTAPESAAPAASAAGGISAARAAAAAAGRRAPGTAAPARSVAPDSSAPSGAAVAPVSAAAGQGSAAPVSGMPGSAAPVSAAPGLAAPVSAYPVSAYPVSGAAAPDDAELGPPWDVSPTSSSVSGGGTPGSPASASAAPSSSGPAAETSGIPGARSLVSGAPVSAAPGAPVSAAPVSAAPGAPVSAAPAAPVSAAPVSAAPAAPVSAALASAAPTAPVSAAPNSAAASSAPMSAAPGSGAPVRQQPEPAGIMPDAPEEPGFAAASEVPGQLSAAAIREVWPEIMTAVSRKSKKIAALAQGATVRDLEGQTVVLTFRFPAHAKMVAAEPALISDALYEALGGRWQIRCDVAGESGPSPGSGGSAPRSPRGGPSGPAQRSPQAQDGPPRQDASRTAPGGASAPTRQREAAPRASVAAENDSGDEWPEPARPGGLATAVATQVTEAAVEEDEEWPEPARPGGAAGGRGYADPSVGQTSPVVDDLTVPGGGQGFGATTGPVQGSADGIGSSATQPGSSAQPSSGPPSVTGSGPHTPSGGGLGNETDGGPGNRVTSGPGNPVSGGPAMTGANPARPVADPGDAGVDPTFPGAATTVDGPNRPGARNGAPAAASPPPSTGRPASSGLAAARAAAAGAGRGTNTAPAAKAGAWSDGSPTEEAPYDPEYDGPPKTGRPNGGGPAFEGFHPGDEPLDDVIDEKTARQSSEQQAVQLLRDALGAEKISES